MGRSRNECLDRVEELTRPPTLPVKVDVFKKREGKRQPLAFRPSGWVHLVEQIEFRARGFGSPCSRGHFGANGVQV